MNNRLSRALILSLLLCASLHTRAEPIAADRPGFSTGTRTVDPGHMNIELGYQMGGGNYSLPLTNARFGLTPQAEAELQWSGWNVSGGSGRIGDVSVGGKYRLPDTGGFKLSLLGLLALPTGGNHPASDGIAPLGALLWSYDGYERAGVFGMLQLASSNPGSLQTQLQPAVGLSFAHEAGLGSFIELFADLPLNHAGNDSYILDGGVSYLLNERAQLDLSLGLSLNGHAADSIGFGFAYSY
jgi:hypothetical protein